ncbi:unnamed protein product [Danaus chrysippus]|uniref:(African queen) hypothetical protein n=1 Tax=Danaus chrysippus TaxID=151541 RepID=A0A8J2QQM9_9NEOP|nr:unnamed protein product [Danaus chrysippus]
MQFRSWTGRPMMKRKAGTDVGGTLARIPYPARFRGAITEAIGSGCTSPETTPAMLNKFKTDRHRTPLPLVVIRPSLKFFLCQ